MNQSDLECCDCFEFLTNDDCASDTNSTVSAIEARFRGTGTDCCDDVNTIITSQSYELDDTAATVMYKTRDELQMETVSVEIGAGEYILPHFRFDSSACIRTVLVIPWSSILPGGNNTLTVSIYKTYASSNFNSKLYEFKTSFSVDLIQQGSLQNVSVGTLDTPVCVESGDTLGFSISSMADYSLASSLTSDVYTHNITDAVFEQPCQQLSKFFEVAPLVGFGYLNNYDPLITVEFGRSFFKL